MSPSFTESQKKDEPRPGGWAVPGGGGQRAIVGNGAGSDLVLRMDRRDAFGMPPLASSVVDANGVQLLRDWIVIGPAR